MLWGVFCQINTEAVEVQDGTDATSMTRNAQGIRRKHGACYSYLLCPVATNPTDASFTLNTSRVAPLFTSMGAAELKPLTDVV